MSSSSSFSPPQPFSVSSSSFMEADEDEEGRERRNPSNSEIRKGRDVSHISQRSTGETYPPDQTSPLSSSSFFSSLQSSDSSSKSYGGKGSLSAAQLLFLEEGIACNVREDGRSCIDIRPSDVYVHVLPKSASSSLVCSTENVVLCGVSVCLYTRKYLFFSAITLSSLFSLTRPPISPSI
ncbi:3 exoribonuclease domain 1 domain-containing protein [Cystoisospora suis]|uniref:3 exoribonuclease domain 1 domain-containing protein n=1 Tax=Cystoisospora suis TaxID=483139 RepID=A0A2C6KQP3_9APIC|nr:3 exoribonuclease domain 1 domain-containing protein [Cystoisospora suis]